MDVSGWIWEPGKKSVADIYKIRTQALVFNEIVVSNDGEKIAVPVRTKTGNFTIHVNGEPWQKTLVYKVHSQ